VRHLGYLCHYTGEDSAAFRLRVRITAFLAANVAYELLSLIAARRREKPARGVSREPLVRH